MHTYIFVIFFSVFLLYFFHSTSATMYHDPNLIVFLEYETCTRYGQSSYLWVKVYIKWGSNRGRVCLCRVFVMRINSIFAQFNCHLSHNNTGADEKKNPLKIKLNNNCLDVIALTVFSFSVVVLFRRLLKWNLHFNPPYMEREFNCWT